MRNPVAYAYASVEVNIDLDSPFWEIEAPIDPDGDPVEVMIRCEEQDLRDGLARFTTYHEFVATHAKHCK